MRLGAPCVLCTVSVPGPIVGAGISGLVAACIGMLGRDTALAPMRRKLCGRSMRSESLRNPKPPETSFSFRANLREPHVHVQGDRW